MGLLSINTEPDNLGCTRPKVRNRVDLPIPFIPTIAPSSPFESAKLILLAIKVFFLRDVYPMDNFLASRMICSFFVEMI